MILTKIELDLRHPGVRQCLRDCQDMHRSVMSGFEDGITRSAGSVLYRLMMGRDKVLMYLLSQPRPDVDSLSAKGLHVLASRCIDPLHGRFVSGSRWSCDLLAMPSKKVAEDVGKNSRRRLLADPESRVQWLTRKGEQNGFAPLSISELPGDSISSWKKGHKMRLTAVRFVGALEVTDQERFWKGFTVGIGPERAWGLGMLMIRPL